MRLTALQLHSAFFTPFNALRRRGAAVVHGFAAAAALSASAGCSDNDASLYVQGVIAPQAPACEYNADPGELLLFRGTLDVAFRSDYQGVVLVANQLTPRGAKNQLRAETSGLEIRGAEVQLSDSQGRVLEEFSVRGGGFIGVSRSEGAGYGLAQITLIPPERGAGYAEELQARPGATRTVVASIRVFGETLGGVELTSGDFTFPIDVCYGCLIDYPLDALEPDGGSFICGTDTEGVSLDQCNPGQDEMIDCRACAASHEVCYRVP